MTEQDSGLIAPKVTLQSQRKESLECPLVNLILHWDSCCKFLVEVPLGEKKIIITWKDGALSLTQAHVTSVIYSLKLIGTHIKDRERTVVLFLAEILLLQTLIVHCLKHKQVFFMVGEVYYKMRRLSF